MRFALPLLLTLAACQDNWPPAPTVEESARLDEADAMLNEAAAESSPTPSELAEAIEAFTGNPVAVADLRRVACAGIEEEPTEAVCKWLKRDGKHWQPYSTYVALDGHGWHLIDEPAPIPEKQ